MPEVKRPRRGSLAFYPRKRARRIYPSVSTYPQSDKSKVLGFAGYKVGMTQLVLHDSIKGSPTFGQDIAVPATILECPPLKVVGLRFYHLTDQGHKAFTELWTKDLPKNLNRKLRFGKFKPKENISEVEKNLEKFSKMRAIVSTQPELSGFGKKTPEVFEIEIGGKDAKEKFDYTKQLLGKEIRINEIVKDGELVDVIAVTKGKGTAGAVKRFGIKIQNRHAKQKRRHVGSLGGERHPSKVRPTVPMAGQLGFQTRTELNKRVLKIAEGKEIVRAGGFPRYGVLKSSAVIVEGSVPGPKKRLVFVRTAFRPARLKAFVPEVKEIVE